MCVYLYMYVRMYKCARVQVWLCVGYVRVCRVCVDDVYVCMYVCVCIGEGPHFPP